MAVDAEEIHPLRLDYLRNQAALCAWSKFPPEKQALLAGKISPEDKAAIVSGALQAVEAGEGDFSKVMSKNRVPNSFLVHLHNRANVRSGPK